MYSLQPDSAIGFLQKLWLDYACCCAAVAKELAGRAHSSAAFSPDISLALGLPEDQEPCGGPYKLHGRVQASPFAPTSILVACALVTDGQKPHKP